MQKRIVAILLFAISCSGVVFAAKGLTPEVHHFFSVDASMGYATLLNLSRNEASSAIMPGPGGGATFGLGYRLYYDKFLFSVGAEGQFTHYTNSIADANMSFRMKDTEGDLFTMHATVKDCRDVCQVANVAVPILFGGEYGHFYFMTGAKVIYNLYGKTSSTSYLTTTGEYLGLIGQMQDMPNHTFITEQKVESGTLPLSLNLNVAAHLELGGRIGRYSLLSGANVPHPLHRWYVAFYMDYGLLNIHKNLQNGQALGHRGGETGDDPVVFYVTPAMISSNLANSIINNLSFGVKFTFLIEQGKTLEGLIYNPTSLRRYSGGLIQKDK